MTEARRSCRPGTMVALANYPTLASDQRRGTDDGGRNFAHATNISTDGDFCR